MALPDLSTTFRMLMRSWPGPQTFTRQSKQALPSAVGLYGPVACDWVHVKQLTLLELKARPGLDP